MNLENERNAMKAIIFAAALSLMPASLPGAELETTHLFGFTLGSDVNDVGEVEGEVETIGRFTKRDGAYAALSNAAAIKFIPFQDFSIEPGLGLAYHDITGVPGLDDRVQWAYEATLLELRYRALNRRSAPFGLTFGMDPHWVRVDDASGEPIDRYGFDLLMIADRELIEDRMFGAFNLVYTPDATRLRASGSWQHQSSLGVSAGLNTQLQPGVLIGAEARYLQSYDGLGLDALTGRALFVGPTWYVKFSERVWMSAAWSIQVAGRPAGERAALDLTNFERHQAVLRVGYNF